MDKEFERVFDRLYPHVPELGPKQRKNIERAIPEAKVNEDECIIECLPGIPREVRDRVFEPFTQVEETNTRHHEGSGLGLSIAKSIVERLHGQIGFTSDPGATTTFWVVLPLPKETARYAA